MFNYETLLLIGLVLLALHFVGVATAFNWRRRPCRWDGAIMNEASETSRRRSTRLETDPENVERDLTRLVLPLVELVRQLVERQCIRRFDLGDLSDEQIEEIGLTPTRLEEAMEELCERFDLSPSNLNLDLEPLGTLLPADQTY